MKLIYLVLAVLLIVSVVPAVSASEYSQTNVLPAGVLESLSQKVVEFKGVTKVSYNEVADGKRVSLVQFTVPAESQVDFIIYYGSNKSVTGSSENHAIEWIPFTNIPVRTQSTITLNGVSKTYDFLDSQSAYDFNFAGYAKSNNESQITGFLVYSGGYGSLDNNLAVFYPVENIAVNTIYQVDMSCPVPFDTWITTNTAQAVAAASSKNIVDQAWDFMNFAGDVAGFVLDLGKAILFWGKFLLWDNLLMEIALYLTLSMAFAARSSRGNMDKFFRQFFSDQKKFFEFMIGTWSAFVALIANMRSIFRI